MSTPLTESTLRYHAGRISVPTYDRAALRRGVVHISVGSFHRSHQAAYFDDLARRGLGDGWAITGVGLHRREMKEVLEAQDGLYTLVERDQDVDRARVIAAITRYLFAPEETREVLDALTDSATRLVTLTITAGGYKTDLDTGNFLSDDRDVANDLAQPSRPGSALGLVVEALDRRRRSGLAPFTVLSCDNMPGNGAVARSAVVGFARLRDERLARWIDTETTFPSSMVDRITPSTTVEDALAVEEAFGVRDRWPVITEPFSDWIIEDSFCNRRPPLDEVGARFVDNVTPYALMKTRLLNGTHSALGYLGSLASYEHIDEVMADPVLAGYTEALMDREIAPLLLPVDVDVHDYAATLRTRFSNSALADSLSRLCRNGSAKVPAHLVSSIRDARASGRPHDLLTLAVAGWVHYLRSADAGALDDPRGVELQALARAGGEDPRPLLADEETFGSLGRSVSFAAAVERDLRDLVHLGAREVVARRTAEHAPLARR